MNTISLYVVDYKTYEKKDHSIGQTIVALSRGYRCNYDCVDQSKFDFSFLKDKPDTVHEFVVGEFHTRLVKAVSKDGASFYMNVPSFRLVSCNK